MVAVCQQTNKKGKEKGIAPESGYLAMTSRAQIDCDVDSLAETTCQSHGACHWLTRIATVAFENPKRKTTMFPKTACPET